MTPHTPTHGTPSEASSDADLVRAAASGSRSALGTLFRRHADRVFRRAYRLTGSRQEAEDVLQDVFVGLVTAFERYEERGRFGSWLSGVTTRVALMSIRARSRRRAEPLAGIPEPSFSETDPVDRLAMRRAIGALPDGQRTVFMLKEIEGYSHAEIADLLDISVSASKVRLHRAWKALEHLGETS